MDKEDRESLPAIITTPAEDIERLSRDDILIEESALVEAWLERTIGEIYQNANSLGLGLKPGTDGALKSCGLNRNTLLAKGFQPHQVDFLYRTMYAHTAGSYYILRGGCGFQVDAEDAENMSKILKLLSSHIQKHGVQPLIREGRQGHDTEGSGAASQPYEPRTSRMLATANAEIVAYSQLKVQREQLYRKLALSREKRNKLKEEVEELVALNKKKDLQLMHGEQNATKMQNELNELREARSQLQIELQNTKNLLASTAANAEDKRKSVTRKGSTRASRAVNRKSTMESVALMTESVVEIAPQDEASTSSSPRRESTVKKRPQDDAKTSRTPNVPQPTVHDFEERSAAAEKRNAVHREENRALSRRSKLLSDAVHQETTNSQVLRSQLEEMMKQGASSSSPPILGRRKSRAGSIAQIAEQLMTERRRSSQSMSANRDSEHQDLVEKYKEMKSLMDVKTDENEELRKKIDDRDGQQKSLIEHCETLKRSADASISEYQHEIEALNARLAKVSTAEEQIKYLEKQCDESKLLLKSKDVTIEGLEKAHSDANAKIRQLSLQEDELTSLEKQRKEIEIVGRFKDAQIGSLKQDRDSHKTIAAQFKELQKQLDGTIRLGEYKDAEIRKLNKELDEKTLKCLNLSEKITKLEAEGHRNEERMRDLQANVDKLNSELNDSKSRESSLMFSIAEFENAKAEEEEEARLLTPRDGPNSEEIQAELKKAQKKNAALQANYDKLESELNFLKTRKGEIFKLHAMLAEAKLDLQKKSEDSSRLLGELNSLRHEVEKVRATRETEKVDLVRALQRLAESDAVQAYMKDDLAQAQKEIEKLHKELSNSGIELVATHGELSRVKDLLFEKEIELIDLKVAESDAKKEKANKLNDLVKRRTVAMKSLILDMSAVYGTLQLADLKTARVESASVNLPAEMHLSENSLLTQNSESTANLQATDILRINGDATAVDEAASSTAVLTRTEGTDEVPEIEDDSKLEEAFEYLNELDKEAEETARTVNEAALKAIESLKSEINIKLNRIEELLQENRSWKEKIGSYALNLPFLVDLLWKVWHKSQLAANTFREVSLRTTERAENVWKNLSDDTLRQNELPLQFVDVFKGQEEVTAMARLEIESGMTLKLKLDEVVHRIASQFMDVLPQAFVSNYLQIASDVESKLKEAMPDLQVIYPPARPPRPELIPEDMHTLLEAQKKITIWQSAVQTEIQRLGAQLCAEKVERRWKDKYVKDMLQKYLNLRAKLGKLADTEFISRPVQTAWIDLWSLFNGAITKAVPAIPDHFADYWESLLQKSKAVKPLSGKTALQTITSLYAAKIKDEYASMQSNKSPHEMPEFIYVYFQDQFGRSPRGEDKLVEFMATVTSNKSQPEVHKFGLTAGMIQDADSAPSEPVLLPREERIPATHLVTQLPANVNMPRLPLGKLQMAPIQKFPSSIEDVWRRESSISLPPIISPRPPGDGSCHLQRDIYPEDPQTKIQGWGKETPRSNVAFGVSRDGNTNGNITLCSPQICNPNVSTPRTRGAGVVLAPLPETALGSPRWRARQARMAVVKDTKLLGMTNEELAHPLAANLLEWKTRFGPSSNFLEDLQHPLAEEATETVFNNCGVQDMLGQLSTQQFLDSAENVDLGVPITSEQLPQLHALLYQACEAMDVEVPLMYVRDSPYCRAYLWCPKLKRPVVVFNSALFDILNPFELQVVMTQQMAVFKYPKYRLLAMAWTVLILAPMLLEQNPAPGTRAADMITVDEFSVGKIKATHNLREVEQKKEKVMHRDRWPVCSTVVSNLDRWVRFVDLVGDRAAYYICRDVTTVVSANMKMAAGSHTLARQLNVSALLEQGHQVDAAVYAKQLHDAFRLGASATTGHGFGKQVNLQSRSEPPIVPSYCKDPMAGQMERRLGHLGVELRSIELLKTAHSLVVLRARELQRWAHETNLRAAATSNKPSAE